MIATTSTANQPNDKERRREKRHNVRTDTFIVNSPNLGQLIDISMSGLAFVYFDWEKWPESFQEMDIFHPTCGYCFHNLPGDTVTDSAIPTFMRDLAHGGQRRRGVHFRELSPAQVEELLQFIESNSTGCK